MHGCDVGVGALLQAVLQRGCGAVAPAPEDSHIGTSAAHTIDGACEDAVLDGGGRCQTMAEETACIVSAGVDSGSDGTTLNEVGAVGEAHES